jgi:hypothetical protein
MQDRVSEALPPELYLIVAGYTFSGFSDVLQALKDALASNCPELVRWLIIGFGDTVDDDGDTTDAEFLPTYRQQFACPPAVYSLQPELRDEWRSRAMRELTILLWPQGVDGCLHCRLSPAVPVSGRHAYTYRCVMCWRVAFCIWADGLLGRICTGCDRGTCADCLSAKGPMPTQPVGWTCGHCSDAPLSDDEESEESGERESSQEE